MNCRDCGKPDPCYHVHKHVWLEAMPDYHEEKRRREEANPIKRGVRPEWKVISARFVGLCFGCLERRLGRPLTLEDFTNSIVNDGIRFGFEMGSRGTGGTRTRDSEG